MQNILEKYIPEKAIDPCITLIKTYRLMVSIVNERRTKHGDYRRLSNGQHKITVNASLNPYGFLITLIHEIAHAVVAIKYEQPVKSHGTEWKNEFRNLILPFINPSIFPHKLLPLLARHFKNPKASTSTDADLIIALKEYDIQKQNKECIYQLPLGTVFCYANQKYKILRKLRKRYECINIDTKRLFRFSPSAEVEVIE